LTYQLLDQFRTLFVLGPYKHRVSTNGDRVALRFYEDIYELGRSRSFTARVDDGLAVLNAANTRRGVAARRGDGSFGELVPGVPPSPVDGFHLARGPIAEIEIGIEVKILAKAMIKQIDRVVSDLTGQVAHFRAKGGNPITIGIVGVNHAEHYRSFEGERVHPTDGKVHKHPFQEAAEATDRLRRLAAPAFDEFLVMPFRATNHRGAPAADMAFQPYDFDWVDQRAIELDYGAILARVSQRYEARHR
jgi:hypothetical protein